ncbi:MAG: nucleotidyl transferase AbiEii/AbiGii toxin family protein [Saprospiraceae bacterium]|nr:nucleotidyl transferase AbiEii/AbiGii toxin family protein [Saprospiraceae bacterium]
MIKPGEIDKIAIKKGVRAKQIEKDYVISWVLWGITRNEFLNKNLVFKGGTCLKKMYFEDYPYSEDMDFTLRDNNVKDEEILENFRRIFEKVYEESRIKVNIIEDTIDNHEDSGSLKFKMSYKATHGTDEIKIDVTRGEKIEFDVEHRIMLNKFSDLDEDETLIHCYSLEEVLIEKITALMGRTIPRDLYDFYYLIEEEGIELRSIYIEFMRKAENKGYNPKEFIDKVMPKMNTFARDWYVSLVKQMNEYDLPDFKNLWRKSSNHFKDLSKLIGS